MHSVKSEFPELKSVKVIVEERRIDLEIKPGNWRTHVYTGLEDVPSRLSPAFASPGTGAELDLASLVRKACATGNVETRFEAPYPDGSGVEKKTVLRSIVVHVYYRKQARAGFRSSRGPAVALAMPMAAMDGVWSRFELQCVARELGKRYSKLSGNVMNLVVRLASLDVPPRAGRSRLLKCATSLLQRRAQATLN